MQVYQEGNLHETRNLKTRVYILQAALYSEGDCKLEQGVTRNMKFALSNLGSH